MKVFLSYSHQDEATAHLLAYILNSHGLQCFVDRQLLPGSSFDVNLRQKIRESDLILVVLTQSSASSAWVNQEVGFALAIDKVVWPLAFEKNIQPDGMLSTTQSYSLFDWSDPSRTIDRLIEGLQGIPAGGAPETYYSKFKLDQVIRGKIERARFISSNLRNLYEHNSRQLSIYLQAAFSSFAFSDDPLYRSAGGHSDEYMGSLFEERESLTRLVRQPRTTFKMILWPVRAYDDAFLAVRYRNLLEWMLEVKDEPNIDFRCARYIGPTRHIVAEHFCIEGYKLHHTTGYEMSLVNYEPSKIENAVKEFDLVFNQASEAGQTKESAIQQIESMYRQTSV